MKTAKLKCAGLALVLAAAACSVGNQEAPKGEPHKDHQSVALGGATSVTANIKMGAGDLTLGPGADPLLDADFSYNVLTMKPQVRYDSSGDHGTLTVEQPSGHTDTHNDRYSWDLHLNPQVPLDLNVDLGAGQGQLNLAGLSVTQLTLNVGAGTSTVNMNGAWKTNMEATIHGGVGKVTVQLPTDVGVRVIAHTGLGAINAGGLTKDGDTYTNAAYGNSKVTLNITVEGGIGEIDLQPGGGGTV